eukprot:m.82382 g.82382  ORF g.82382 m.82382 type:complete len:106 (-) comp16326_c0_seq2:665-982(-)
MNASEVVPPIFHYGDVVDFDEDEMHEFKIGSNPLAPRRFRPDGDITKNIIAFLNSSVGGSLYLGINDDGVCRGCFMNRGDRDRFRQRINSILRSINPAVLPSKVP